jgi:hypothetical protein
MAFRFANADLQNILSTDCTQVFRNVKDFGAVGDGIHVGVYAMC